MAASLSLSQQSLKCGEVMNEIDLLGFSDSEDMYLTVVAPNGDVTFKLKYDSSLNTSGNGEFDQPFSFEKPGIARLTAECDGDTVTQDVTVYSG